MEVQTRSKIGSIALELYLGRYFDQLIIDLRKWRLKIPKFGKKNTQKGKQWLQKSKTLAEWEIFDNEQIFCAQTDYTIW